MFRLFGFIKKRLFNVTDEKEILDKNEGTKTKNENVVPVKKRRKTPERRAFERLKQNGSLDSVTKDEYQELLDNEADKIRQEDLESKKLLRTIKTLRTEEDIQKALDSGHKILEQDVEPSEKIKVTDVYIKNTETGEVYTRPDCYSTIIEMDNENRKFIKKKTYYPYTFPSNMAAYVLPDDIKTGERVILQDLIEDVVGSKHAWGTYRLESAEAVWDGKKFNVDHDHIDFKVTMG